MTTMVAGMLRGGRLELLEEPAGLRDGRVLVTIEEQPGHEPAATVDRRAFLRLPLEERRRILRAQADLLAPHCERDSDWRAWLAGDIVE